MSTTSVSDPAAAMWRDLTITLSYSWAYMANVVMGTDILCGGHMNRDEGELDAIRGINHTQRFSSEEKYNISYN